MDENDSLNDEFIEMPQTKEELNKEDEITPEEEQKESGTKKTLKAIGRIGVAVYTSGASVGKDKKVLKSQPVNKTIGVVANTLDQVPGVEEASEVLDESGIVDSANDALDVVSDIKNADIKSANESAEKLKEDVGKTAKFATAIIIKKFILPAIIGFLLNFFLLAIFVIIICGPVIGGFLDVVESEDGDPAIITPIDDDGASYDDEVNPPNPDNPGDNDNSDNDDQSQQLSDSRSAILAACETAVSAAIPYNYGGHPFGAGIRGYPSAGLDCAGFVQWALWTGLGHNPGYLTTQAISDRIGSSFIEIPESDLKPGDIGLKRRGADIGDNYNHTGIYAGNGMWYHASAGSRTRRVVKSNYSDFKLFVRYVGVD